MDNAPEFNPDQIALFVDLENRVNIASSLGVPVDMQPVTMRGLHQNSPGLPFVPAALREGVGRSQEELEAILHEIGIDFFTSLMTAGV